MTDRKNKQLAVPDWNYNGVSQVPGTNNTFVGTSFVQILKDNGYHTIHCGKAHFGSIVLIISANEIFWMSAGIFLVLLGLVWFAKPPFGAGGGGGGAH